MNILLPVPEREGDVEAAMSVSYASDTIFTPSIGSEASLVVRKV
jgi:hypothetical protein